WAVARLAAAGVPCCEDRHGNLLVGVDSLTDYRRRLRQRAAGPLALLIAHMDHPGFHGSRWRADGLLEIRWHGGGPVRHLTGARVWLRADDGAELGGRLQRPRLDPRTRRLLGAEVRLDTDPGRRPAARRWYGGLAFRAPCWSAGNRLYTRAADDLAGVFAVVETACALQSVSARRRPGAEVLGLLTRAEEVGFVGALAHLDDGWLQQATRTLLCVSLEASRQGPGALQGAGPVVRLGDRQSTFSAGAARRLELLAAELLPGAHQRRLMDGGVCEGTTTMAHGLTTAGLAVPLGNYHNCNLDGGADAGPPGGPAPEFIDTRDVAGLLALCRGFAERPWAAEPWAPVRARLARLYRERGPALRR
ncbi:MAG TPA: hypothetical protein VIX81_00120, partial [Gammaproteobacteria bacterium]